MTQKLKTRIRAWLELVRVPNLLTVPGDALAGFLLASGGLTSEGWPAMVLVAVGTVLIYSAGMVWNDVADYAEDSRVRPQRPLPSGRITPKTAFFAGIVLVLLALALFTAAGQPVFWAGLGLVGLVGLYDFGRGRFLGRWPAFIVMGGCRGMSVLLGALAGGAGWVALPLSVMMVAGAIALYVVVISRLAVDEVYGTFLSRYIGIMIRFLIVLQASVCLYAGGFWIGVALLAGWPLAGWLGRRFYAS